MKPQLVRILGGPTPTTPHDVQALRRAHNTARRIREYLSRQVPSGLYADT